MNDQPPADRHSQTSFRSPLLLDRHQSLLLVVDVQEKLMPSIDQGPRVGWNIERLLAGAAALQIPRWGSEQYPAGLGPTIPSIRPQLSQIAEKRMFSCRECDEIALALDQASLRQVVVVGIETHVCVLQTAMDLQSAGFDVFIPVDAVGSRRALDHQTALDRMSHCGLTLTTTEGVLFEWCETSAVPEFKAISHLVRKTPPG